MPEPRQVLLRDVPSTLAAKRATVPNAFYAIAVPLQVRIERWSIHIQIAIAKREEIGLWIRRP